MKILLTGATGFLGRHVLRALISDERVSEIVAVTRSRDSHPDPKVKIAKLDLSVPTGLAALPCDFDAVVHLAGAYDFQEGYADNYLGNVMAMTHLIAWLEAHDAKASVHYASTYAVNAGCWRPDKSEDPVAVLPDKRQAYAHSKAVAERALLRADVPVVVHRLGILIGDSAGGRIEKIDGPYYLLKFLAEMKQLPVLRRLPVLPLPARSDAYVPLVPVDAAAGVIHAGLFLQHEPQAIYGVYNPDSLSVDELVGAVLTELGSQARPLYIDRIPRLLGRLQSSLTGVPEALFDFTSLPARLANDRFAAVFGAESVPHFTRFKAAFFAGFHEFTAYSSGTEKPV